MDEDGNVVDEQDVELDASAGASAGDIDIAAELASMRATLDTLVARLDHPRS